MALVVTPISCHRWLSSRPEPVRVVGCFPSPLAPHAGGGNPPHEIAPCSVIIADESRKVVGSSEMRRKGKRWFSGKRFSNITFSCVNTEERVTLLFPLSKTKIGLTAVIHDSEFPHKEAAVVDLGKEMWQSCEGICSKPQELGIRQAAVRFSPAGLLVAVIIANGSGSSFIVRINATLRTSSRVPLDFSCGSAPHLSIDVVEGGRGAACVITRCDVTSPSAEARTPVEAERSPFSDFDVHHYPPLSSRGATGASAAGRTLQVRTHEIGWSDAAFCTSFLESAIFAPVDASFAAMCPHGHPCPFIVTPWEVVTLLPAGNDSTYCIQLPRGGRHKQCHAKVAMIYGLAAPMHILPMSSGLYLIQSEDNRLFAVHRSGEMIDVVVATASLVPGMPRNRLAVPCANNEGYATNALGRLSIHAVAPNCVLATDGVVGALMKITAEPSPRPARFPSPARERSPSLESWCVTWMQQRLRADARSTPITQEEFEEAIAFLISAHQWNKNGDTSTTKRSQRALSAIDSARSELSKAAAPPPSQTMFIDDFLAAIGRDHGLRWTTIEETICRLVQSSQLSSGCWGIHTPLGGTDILRTIGTCLLCSCLDVPVVLSIGEDMRLSCCAAVQAEQERSRTRKFCYLEPMEFESAAAYDQALVLCADLLSIRDAEQAEYPVDCIIVALLCCGRFHALETVIRLLPSQWSAVCHDLSSLLHPTAEDSTQKGLFLLALEAANVTPSAMLAVLLGPRTSSTDTVAKRVLWALSSFSGGPNGPAVLTFLCPFLPAEVYLFLLAVRLHDATELLLREAQYRAVQQMSQFLPSASSHGVVKHRIAHAKEQTKRALDTCTSVVSLIPAATRTTLQHGLLYPQSRGKMSTLAARTVERDLRLTCLLSFQLQLEGSLDARQQEVHQNPTPCDLNVVVSYVVLSVQTCTALQRTLLPVEVLQLHCLDAVERLVAVVSPLLGADRPAEGESTDEAASLLAFAREVLAISRCEMSDIVSIKRKACLVSDRIQSALHAMSTSSPSSSSLPSSLQAVLDLARGVPKDDTRRADCIEARAMEWTLEELTDGRHDFLINGDWAKFLWPVEYFRSDWFPIVESVLGAVPTPPPPCPTELSATLRKALFAAVCAVAPPLRAFQEVKENGDGVAMKRAVEEGRHAPVEVRASNTIGGASAAPLPTSSSPPVSTTVKTSNEASAHRDGSSPLPTSTLNVCKRDPTNVPLSPQPVSAPTPVPADKAAAAAAVPPVPAAEKEVAAPESITFTAAEIAWWDEGAISVDQVAVRLGGATAEGDTSDTSFSNATSLTSSAATPAHRTRGNASDSSDRGVMDKDRRSSRHHRHVRHLAAEHRHPHICSKHRQPTNRPQQLHRPQVLPSQVVVPSQAMSLRNVPVPSNPAPLAAPVVNPAHLSLTAPADRSQMLLSQPSALEVPQQLHLQASMFSRHPIRLVDPSQMTSGAGCTSALPPPPGLPTSSTIPPSVLQPPPVPSSSVTIANPSMSLPPPMGAAPWGGMLGVPQPLALPQNAKRRSHRSRRHKSKSRRSKRSTSSSSSSSTTSDKATQKREGGGTRKEQSQQNKSENQGKNSTKLDVMQTEDLNRLYYLLEGEVPLPPGEVMYRGQDNAMKLATAPTVHMTGAAATATLPPSEQAKFRSYVDGLLLRNREQDSAPISQSAARFGPPPTGGANASHEEFLKQLAAQQHAMFQAQQDLLMQQQRENANLVRRIAEGSGSANVLSRDGAGAASGASSPLRSSEMQQPRSPMRQSNADSRIGLSALQQAQLVEDTMDYRRRVLQLSEELLKLQQKVSGGNTPTFSSTPMPPPQSSGSRPPMSSSHPQPVSTQVQTSLNGPWHRPAETHSIGVGEWSVGGQQAHAGVQTHGLQQRAATPPNGAPPPSHSTVDASRVSLLALHNELRRLTEGTNEVEKASAEAAEMLRRSSMYHSASDFVAEQQSAIDALRKKAAGIQSALLLNEQRNSTTRPLPPSYGRAPSDHFDNDLVRSASVPCFETPQQQGGASGISAHSWPNQWISETEGSDQPPQGDFDRGASYSKPYTTEQQPRSFVMQQEAASHPLQLQQQSAERVFEDVLEVPAEPYCSPRRVIGGGQHGASAFLNQTMLPDSRPATQQEQRSPQRSRPQSSMWEPMQRQQNSIMNTSAHGGFTHGGAQSLATVFEAAKHIVAAPINPATGGHKQHQKSQPTTSERKPSSHAAGDMAVPQKLRMYAAVSPNHRGSATRKSPACRKEVATTPVNEKEGPVPKDVVLQPKRSLSVGDKFAHKQREMLEAHTRARIAAVKNALK